MRTNRTYTHLLLAVALLFGASSLHAEIYKWTDENGKVHYSDKKPENKQKVAEVKVRTGKGTPNPNSAKQEIKDKESQLNDKATKLSQKEQKKGKASKSQCATVRENLSKIQTGRRMRINEDGEYRYLTPEELKEKQEKYVQFLEENC